MDAWWYSFWFGIQLCKRWLGIRDGTCSDLAFSLAFLPTCIDVNNIDSMEAILMLWHVEKRTIKHLSRCLHGSKPLKKNGKSATWLLYESVYVWQYYRMNKIIAVSFFFSCFLYYFFFLTKCFFTAFCPGKREYFSSELRTRPAALWRIPSDATISLYRSTSSWSR